MTSKLEYVLNTTSTTIDIHAFVVADVPKIATALGGTPVPSPYKGLCYAGASVANKTIAVTGVQPQSRPNILGSAPPQRLTNGGVISASVDGCSGKCSAHT